MARPTLFVVDDNRGVRRSLRALGESVGLAVETYASNDEFLREYDPEQLGCLLLDVRLAGGQNGLDLQDELRRRGASLPIIVMTAYATVPATVRTFRAGAFDFLRKLANPRKLLERVHAAIDAHRQALAVARSAADVRGRLRRLTRRERQVTELLLGGQTSKEIAMALGLSVRTVEGHRRMILTKMQVSSVTRLIRELVSGAPAVQEEAATDREKTGSPRASA